MEFVLPVILAFLAFVLAKNYAKAVLYRRKIILPLVESFIEDDNAPMRAKLMAYHAFKDSLDYKLILKIRKASKEPKFGVSKVEAHDIYQKFDKRTRAKLNRIFEECVTLNIRFALPMYLYSAFTDKTVKVHVNRKEKAVEAAKQKTKRAFYSYTLQEDDEKRILC